jgi:hypothetical protein
MFIIRPVEPWNTPHCQRSSPIDGKGPCLPYPAIYLSYPKAGIVHSFWGPRVHSYRRARVQNRTRGAMERLQLPPLSLVDGTSLLPRHRSGLTKTATSQPFWPMCSPFHASTHRIEDPWNGGAFRFLSLRLESAPTFLPATDLDYPRTGQSSSGVHASTYSYVHAYNAGPVESPKSIAHSDPTWLAGAARAAGAGAGTQRICAAPSRTGLDSRGQRG